MQHNKKNFLYGTIITPAHPINITSHGILTHNMRANPHYPAHMTQKQKNTHERNNINYIICTRLLERNNLYLYTYLHSVICHKTYP